MSALARLSICAICTRLLKLETCKVDEFGRAVHDGCYLSKVAAGQPKRDDKLSQATTGNPLHRAIVDFLHSASTSSVPVFCCVCGSAVEFRNSTFFYGAQSWEISLPICRKCNPTSRLPNDA